MATDATGQVKVTDEEHGVDQQLKSQVLDIRKTVDQDERSLYVDRLRDPDAHYNRSMADQDWALSVRQYLRAIKRLWTDAGDISGVPFYWGGQPHDRTGQRLSLGAAQLVPPDTQGYDLSLVARAEHMSPDQLRRAIGLPRGAELPEVHQRQFVGLSDVLNTRVVEHTWVVTVDDSGPPPAHETVTAQAAQAVPKHVLENALEAADAFLQQAGLGFETSLPDYYGGNEPGI